MTDTLAAQIEAQPCSVQVIRDMDVPKGAWPWIDGIAAECTGPHLRIETPNDAEAIVFWHDERPAAVVLNLRDQFNHSVQFRIDLRPAIVTALGQAEGNRDHVIQVLKDIDDGVYDSLDDRADAIFAALRQAEAAPGVVEELRTGIALMMQMRGWHGSSRDVQQGLWDKDIAQYLMPALARQHGALPRDDRDNTIEILSRALAIRLAARATALEEADGEWTWRDIARAPLEPQAKDL